MWTQGISFRIKNNHSIDDQVAAMKAFKTTRLGCQQS